MEPHLIFKGSEGENLIHLSFFILEINNIISMNTGNNILKDMHFWYNYQLHDYW